MPENEVALELADTYRQHPKQRRFAGIFQADQRHIHLACPAEGC